MTGDAAILSPVDSLENADKASGKFGGVAGVLAGAPICYKKSKKKYICRNKILNYDGYLFSHELPVGL